MKDRQRENAKISASFEHVVPQPLESEKTGQPLFKPMTGFYENLLATVRLYLSEGCLSVFDLTVNLAVDENECLSFLASGSWQQSTTLRNFNRV